MSEENVRHLQRISSVLKSTTWNERNFQGLLGSMIFLSECLVAFDDKEIRELNNLLLNLESLNSYLLDGGEIDLAMRDNLYLWIDNIKVWTDRNLLALSKP